MKIFQGEELPQPKSMLLVSFSTWFIEEFAVKQTRKQKGKSGAEK